MQIAVIIEKHLDIISDKIPNKTIVRVLYELAKIKPLLAEPSVARLFEEICRVRLGTCLDSEPLAKFERLDSAACVAEDAPVKEVYAMAHSYLPKVQRLGGTVVTQCCAIIALAAFHREPEKTELGKTAPLSAAACGEAIAEPVAASGQALSSDGPSRPLQVGDIVLTSAGQKNLQLAKKQAKIIKVLTHSVRVLIQDGPSQGEEKDFKRASVTLWSNASDTEPALVTPVRKRPRNDDDIGDNDGEAKRTRVDEATELFGALIG